MGLILLTLANLTLIQNQFVISHASGKTEIVFSAFKKRTCQTPSGPTVKTVTEVNLFTFHERIGKEYMPPWDYLIFKQIFSLHCLKKRDHSMVIMM